MRWAAASPLRGGAAIGQAVGAVLGRRHMAKHFQISITDNAFSFAQNPLSIAAEAALDGIYVIRFLSPIAVIMRAGSLAFRMMTTT